MCAFAGKNAARVMRLAYTHTPTARTTHSFPNTFPFDSGDTENNNFGGFQENACVLVLSFKIMFSNGDKVGEF